MLTRKIETDFALHRRHELNVRFRLEDLFDERKIRGIIFDIKDGALVSFVNLFMSIQADAIARCQTFDRRCRPGKLNPKSAALSDRAVDADRAAHFLDETSRKGQAQTRALDVRLFCPQTIERSKQAREFIGRNSRTGITYDQAHLLVAG